jgi:hypothetical protein
MATIKQVVEEIRNSKLSPDSKKQTIRIINLAVERIEEKKAETIRTPKAKASKTAITLQEWETAQGKRLDIRMMIDWLDRNNYAIDTMAQLVEEFRTDMISKAKPYADFRAAFQNYFNKGFLSIKPDSPRVKRASATTLDRRGFSL